MDNDGICTDCKANFNFNAGQCCADGSVSGSDFVCTTYAAGGGNGVS